MGRIKNFHIDPDKLLDCVYVVLRERGLGGLTLDAVAATAGISKGGLIHHFPSKRALLDAVVDREARQFEEEYRSSLARQVSGPGARCRALLEVFQPMFEKDASTEWTKTDLAVYAASMESPELVRPFSELMQKIAGELEADGISVTQARLFLAVLIGLYHEAAQPVAFCRETSREVFLSLKSHLESLITAAHPAKGAPRRVEVLVPSN